MSRAPDAAAAVSGVRSGRRVRRCSFVAAPFALAGVRSHAGLSASDRSPERLAGSGRSGLDTAAGGLLDQRDGRSGDLRQKPRFAVETTGAKRGNWRATAPASLAVPEIALVEAAAFRDAARRARDLSNLLSNANELS